ncbi:MAG TPA: ABC-2 family transporter protein [Candidatus Methylomirabilis sp.]|nr:ABC-2 family transporter protein [Candidatus Methylomirabilis sp.]
MLGTLRNYASLAAVYTRLNLNAQLEYRGGFATQVAAMFVNNCVWVIFWILFFTRFPVLRGWDVRDVITIWALAASGYGLAHAVYGNALHLANLIAQGQLDVWMLYPRALLSHLLLGRMSATAWGDALFGYAVYIALVRPSPGRLCLFVALSLSAAALFVGFSVLSGSLSFFLGNSATLTEQWRMAMVTLSTYPATLFGGTVKLVLYTLVPAAFVTYLPIIALRDLSLAAAALTVAGSLGFLLLSAGVFYQGLRRYESGNLLAMRE